MSLFRSQLLMQRERPQGAKEGTRPSEVDVLQDHLSHSPGSSAQDSPRTPSSHRRRRVQPMPGHILGTSSSGTPYTSEVARVQAPRGRFGCQELSPDTQHLLADSLARGQCHQKPQPGQAGLRWTV